MRANRPCHAHFETIAHCVLLYVRFPLSLQGVEEMMLLHGVRVSYETIHRCRRRARQRTHHQVVSAHLYQ